MEQLPSYTTLQLYLDCSGLIRKDFSELMYLLLCRKLQVINTFLYLISKTFIFYDNTFENKDPLKIEIKFITDFADPFYCMKYNFHSYYCDRARAKFIITQLIKWCTS
jgi:hypothetical protein